MKYQHLTIEEREKIQEMLWQKASIRDIAAAINRHPSSVFRELRRNYPARHRQYTSRLAHERALEKRKCRGRELRLKSQEVRDYVQTKLRKRWSPEQIAGTIEDAIGQTISHEAIYQYIYAQIYREGYGYLKPGAEDFRSCLRRRWKRRHRKGGRKSLKIQRSDGLSIDERPLIVAKRKRLGDWESDTVESIEHKTGINTLVERKTGFVLITRLSGKSSNATMKAIAGRLGVWSGRARHTVTFDNGPENSNWRDLEYRIGIKTYFAHAYHSWERGTNENTNGLIRDYFPKKTDFSEVTDEKIRYVENELNNRPRKRLGFKTPLQALGVALQC